MAHSSKSDDPNWSGVHVALDLYFEREPERNALINCAPGQIDVNHWIAICNAHVNEVREAFFEATKDRNSRDTIMQCLAISDAVKMSNYVQKRKHS